MTDAEAALDTAQRLRSALVTEIESARDERRLLRTLDADGLFARATHRSAFLVEVRRLERMLAIRMKDLAQATGHRAAATTETPRAGSPAPETALDEVVAEIRALADALAEIDRLNASLAQRALSVVRGYVDALRPAPGTYDRFGARTAAPTVALVRSQG